MSDTLQENNKAIVLEAFDAVFNRRDDGAFERFFSPDYLQHSSHIPPGREGLRALVKALPASVGYENHVIAASGDYVILHGRYFGIPGRNWIAADIIRMKHGVFLEHWDVIQDEATSAESQSGAPMFGDEFPKD